MNETDEPFFLDTNILVYAHKSDEGEKHIIAKQLVEACMKGEKSLTISNQILGEFCRCSSQTTRPPKTK